ncbi:ATP-binding cassette domain-containing protein [Methylobacterium sp. WSM2598]|uniref:ATP-binding cassette domain-containing protein n=1 Tax=Methylobacterium sp. WSM2598 TaxID=398261 RepID=UPI000A021190|nr:ATP-binding cassette domain-containing protein [Methylobacterium sp. WSM2598]
MLRLSRKSRCPCVAVRSARWLAPNGAGKSSLKNVVSGLYKPDPGTVRLNGRSFGGIRSDRLGHLGVAQTFQNLAFFGGLSVRDNVSSGLTEAVLNRPELLRLSRSEEIRMTRSASSKCSSTNST